MSGSNRQQITTGEELDARPDWLPDGSLLAFPRVLSLGMTQIFIVAADGTSERQLTDIAPDPAATHSISSDPTWSPDGQRIAFANNNRTVPLTQVSSIYIVNIDGTGLVELVPPDAYYSDPRWSPDGEELVVFQPQITGRDLDGSEIDSVEVAVGASSLRRIVGQDFSNPDLPVWSPVGMRMALALTPVQETFTYITYGKRGIHIIDFTTGNKQQITHTGYDPSWSPDGQYLAFEFGGRVSFGIPGIAITDLSGRTQWVVTNDGAHPQWRPAQPTQ